MTITPWHYFGALVKGIAQRVIIWGYVSRAHSGAYCRCKAVHPGYGFLSENAEFVESCESAGLAFLGPTAATMRMFSRKHTAREFAQSANVPVLPGAYAMSVADGLHMTGTEWLYPHAYTQSGVQNALKQISEQTHGDLGSSLKQDSEASRVRLVTRYPLTIGF